MTRDEWLAIEELFHRAAAQPEDQREQWVRASCGSDPKIEEAVLQMLAEDRAGDDDIVETLSDAAVNWLDGSDPKPSRIGPWRILRTLGSGGMGHVYLGSRDDAEYQKLVAVKVLNKGVAAPGVRQRFLQERQILAELDHPNIARMLDGGTTPDGLPYLVLEYVDGQPLVEYCAPLTLHERCRLFVSVCEAVAYAHQRLIVHRDLKPANILVDKNGIPKLLDFGIAKLLRADVTSDHTQAFFTADYASPEQLQGQPVTTATDVYALGAILYELIAGRPAHGKNEGSFAELVSAVCDRDVERPSHFAKDVPPDLDNVLMKAMAREPERRYRTAFEFAEDLKRFLDERPVAARGDSWTYVAGKFVRRHRVVVAMVAMLLMALAGSTIWSWMAMREAEHQRALATERSAKLRSLTHHLLFDVQASLDGVVGATKARRMLVKTALDHFELMMKESGGDPELRRDLAVAYRRIADVQGWPRNPNLEDLGGAIASYQRAVDLLQGLDHTTELRWTRMIALAHMADTYVTWGRGAEAVKAYEDSLAAVPPDEGSNAERATRISRMVDVLSSRARFRALQQDAKGAQSDLAEARRLLDQGLQIDPKNSFIARARVNQHIMDAYTLSRERKLPEALAEANAAVAKGKALPLELTNSPERHTLMRAYMLRCDLLGDPGFSQHDYAAALRDAERSIELAEQLVNAEPSSARGRYELSLGRARQAAMLRYLRRYDEALTAARKCLSEAEAVHQAQPGNTDYHSYLGQSQLRIANVLFDAGKGDQAMPYFRTSLETLRLVLKKVPLEAAGNMMDACERIGDIAAKRNQTAEAARSYREGLQILEQAKAVGDRHHEEFEARVRKKLCRATGQGESQPLCR